MRNEDKDVSRPTRSWWLEARTREEFDAAVARETERMKHQSHAITYRPMVIGWGKKIGGHP